jgi:hypothetical protein
MAKITTDHICIKSKTTIMVGTIAIGMGLGLLVALSVIITSVALHNIASWGPFGYLWFGVIGLLPFIQTLPWVWIGLSFALILLGFKVLKHYDFSYRTGYRMILLTFCCTVLGLAFIVDKIGIHQHISRQPLLRQIYISTGDGNHWMSGEVIIASQSGMVIVTPNQQQVVIRVTKSTKLPAGSNFQPGTKVQTIGSFVDNFFEAEGIRF